MTVQDLIKKLEEFPSDMNVVLEGANLGVHEVYYLGQVYSEEKDVTQDDDVYRINKGEKVVILN